MTEKIFQKRSRIFKVGIILIIFFSAVIGFFNIAVLYWFGLPILGLLAGTIAVWFSKESIKTKILSSILPLPIILFSFFLFYLLLPKAEPETILLPQNFRGHLVVVFDEPCGQSLAYEKGRRIYRIPNNGILIINAKQTFGVIDRKFYLVDENGNKVEMPEFHWSKFEQEQNDWHWTFSSTKLSKNLIGVFWAYTNRFSFIVSDYLSLEEQNVETLEKRQKAFSENIETILKQCRQTR
jgi:hypothetical protein